MKLGSSSSSLPFELLLLLLLLLLTYLYRLLMVLYRYPWLGISGFSDPSKLPDFQAIPPVVPLIFTTSLSIGCAMFLSPSLSLAFFLLLMLCLGYPFVVGCICIFDWVWNVNKSQYRLKNRRLNFRTATTVVSCAVTVPNMTRRCEYVRLLLQQQQHRQQVYVSLYWEYL